MKDKAEDKRFITVKQMAKLLGCTIHTVTSLARNKKIRGYKLGKRWYFEEGNFLPKD